MNYPILISALSAAFAGSAFIVSCLNYRVSRKLPNENKLFEEKFKSYRAVIAALNTAAAVYLECAHEYQILELPARELVKAKEELEEELAKAYYLMEDTIYEQTLVLPDEVLEPIDNFFALFNHDDFLNDTAKAGKTDEFETQINDIFDDVIDAMREDLAFNKLDKGLKKRIGAGGRLQRLRKASDTREPVI
ncbi:hypothetical protein SNE25_04045 [Mucilaginibacter sabulilitoris]|uniref:DUF4760 domain-containing protein n=1 Tax=Mucilaginibacter sabulilitoris TaxID=1173583 RepID=A0ABZ0TU48_9SPHI|nr:hypothetical protein [Mucilaginibacter sabulilitoris]WPU94690.1 hypothetical protein SNE25_04045 [Mucilaginibacter sabulilitoris]